MIKGKRGRKRRLYEIVDSFDNGNGRRTVPEGGAGRRKHTPERECGSVSTTAMMTIHR